MKIGDQVSFRFGFAEMLTHTGVCVGFDGLSLEPEIAHNSQRFGEVRISRLSEFSEGRPCSVVTTGLQRSVPEVLRVVSGMVGRKYSLLSFNCEHFVNLVRKGRAYSSQVNTAAAIAIVIWISRSK